MTPDVGGKFVMRVKGPLIFLHGSGHSTYACI